MTFDAVFVTLCLWMCIFGCLLAADNTIIPSCPPEAKTCRFTFNVSFNITMMAWNTNELGEPDAMLVVITGKDGKLYAKRKDCSGQDPLKEEDFETFLSGDGNYKRIISVNRQLPGTPIVVYTGQQVSVIVKNGMENEVMTLHWHGLHMCGTPWMDGAGYVSHCPIQPRQTFEYRFVADKAGTFWYHGHIGIQRTMGLAGHLTVLHRSPEVENENRGCDRLPIFDDEFHLMVADWSKKPTDEEYYMGASDCIFDPELADGCSHKFTNVDGTSPTSFYSAIINGKGQRYKLKSNTPEHPEIPIEVFTVKKNGRYRFRIVNSGMNVAFRISIDQHKLHVTASDGSDVMTTTVSHLVTSGGETYDVYIDATDPGHHGNYWIRAETLEYMDGENKVQPRHVKAILRYEGAAADIVPSSQPHHCTQAGKCIHLNCISRFYPEDDHITCLPLTALRHPMGKSTLTPSDGNGFTEYILALQVGAMDQHAMINAIKHVPHTVPPQIYPQNTGAVKCEDECATKCCSCTHELNLPKDHIIQLTIYSYRSESSPPLSFHPVHLHGHDFQVIKLGWPVYNMSTGRLLHSNQDIDCGKHPGCHSPRWADKNWEGGNLPAIINESAPIKNTILVPAGGYVVVRFKADNPGYWLLHCHMELHQLEGMTLVFKEGEVSDMPDVPRGFPVCGDFDWSSEDFHQKIHQLQPRNKRSMIICGYAVEAQEAPCLEGVDPTYQAATVGLAATLSILTLLLIAILTKTAITKSQPGITAGLLLRSNSSSGSSRERMPLLPSDG